MSYRIIDMDNYYRAEVFRHFSVDCKCSVSMTKRVDVTRLLEYSKSTGTKFYINFLYALCKALNAREDYRMHWDWESQSLLCYDKINPIQYIFHPETETFSVMYTEYDPDYRVFCERAAADVEKGKAKTRADLHNPDYPNWFDASCIPWIDYDSLNIELPDGYLYLAPVVNWGRYSAEGDRVLMPLTIRLNHAVADGYLLAQAFLTVQREMDSF